MSVRPHHPFDAMLIPPEDAKHFLRVYQELLRKIAVLEGKKPADLLAARLALYEGKHLAHPPTRDKDLLAALGTACYGGFVVGRHLVRCTEMVGPENRVYRVQGLTDEPGDIVPPWLMVETAVMQFRGRWICDGLMTTRNIHVGPNMRRELAETIRQAKPPALDRPTVKKPAGSRAKTGVGTKNKGTAKLKMSKIKEDEDRENRIIMEIVVDAYDAEERALGWYYHLQDTLGFPFPARCSSARATSPLKKGDEIEVLALAPEEECEREMFVQIRWEKRKLAVPLSQLEVLDSDDDTKQAVDDWHYWTNRGYRF